jgi:hypothetical protein
MMAACSVCKRELAPGEVLYSPEAAVICQKCLDGKQVSADNASSGTAVSKSAYANLAIAVFGLLFVNPFFIFSIGPVIHAILLIHHISKQQKIGLMKNADLYRIVAVLGAALGVLSFLLVFVRRR